MTYDLAFHEKALREWKALEEAVKARFKKALARRLEEPRVEAARLHGPKDRYKIKLMNPGFRLVYEVSDAESLVKVMAVGKREDVYEKADLR